MAIAFGFQCSASMKTLDSQCDWANEKTHPPLHHLEWMVHELITIFYWGSNYLVGSIASIAKFEGGGGLGVEQLIKSFLL